MKAGRVPLVGLAVSAALGLAACGSSGSKASTSAEATGNVVAQAGAIQVLSPFVPQPASPDVASAYLGLRNTGSTADTLQSASSPVAASTQAMSEGAGSMPGMAMSDGQMMALGAVQIPAHGTFAFTPGHDHLMLQGLRTTLKSGQTVTLQLDFAHAGPVTVTAPVTPLDSVLGSKS